MATKTKRLVVSVPGQLMIALRNRVAQEMKDSRYHKTVTVSDVVRRILSEGLGLGRAA